MKKQITISYSITSQKCLKSIVSGVKSFGDDAATLRFVKRLSRLKNALCKRYLATQYYYGDGAPYILSYNCKTV